MCCFLFIYRYIFLTQVTGMDFKSFVSNLYYQTLALIKLTLQNITRENRVKYLPQSEQTQPISKKRDIKSNLGKKKNSTDKLTQNNKIIQKNLPEKDLEYLKEERVFTSN